MSDLPIPHIAPGEPILEQDFMECLRRALNTPGSHVRVFRQNSGAVTTRDRSGRVTGRFSAGAPTGAADLSGLATVNVGGVKLALRLECEVKVDHKHTPEQVIWGEMINRMGGVYVLLRYDHALSLSANVAAGVAAVDAAIAARVAG